MSCCNKCVRPCNQVSPCLGAEVLFLFTPSETTPFIPADYTMRAESSDGRIDYYDLDSVDNGTFKATDVFFRFGRGYKLTFVKKSDGTHFAFGIYNCAMLQTSTFVSEVQTVIDFTDTDGDIFDDTFDYTFN